MSAPDNAVDFDACYLCWGAGGYDSHWDTWEPCTNCNGQGGWYVDAAGQLLNEDGTPKGPTR